LTLVELNGLLIVNLDKVKLAPWLELSKLEYLSLWYNVRRYKAAKGRAIGGENGGLVSGPDDAANGVRVVDRVGRMGATLTTRCPGPLQLRSNEADADTGRLMRHSPFA
jgi:hypothetical protein